jgi:hypothetical protein
MFSRRPASSAHIVFREVVVSPDRTQGHTHTHTHMVGVPWTSDQPVAEGSTITTHNIHKRITSMPSARLEPIIPASGRPQTYPIDLAATGIDL